MTRIARRTLLPLLLAAVAAAQPPTPQQPKQDPPPDRAALDRAAVKWLASDQNDESLLGVTVRAIRAAGEDGLRWLGEKLQAEDGRSTPYARGLRSLVRHVCLDFLEQARKSGMQFAGQYAPLRHLQPVAGELFERLLLDPPDWYPSNQRLHVVPVLRDLLTAPPGPDLLDRLEGIAGDEAREESGLRRALAFALHQWGRPALAQKAIDRWRAQSAEGDLEDRVHALRSLADVHYQLRDYKAAAAVHVSMQGIARAGQVDLWPSDHYWAACCFALMGDLERAWAAFDECVAMQASPHVDPSLKLERSLFEKDPDIARLRGSERFEAALRKAFPEPAGAKDGERRDR